MTTFYGEQHRKLHDQFDSRQVADVLEAVIVRPEIDDEAKAFIESRSFFFLSIVNAEGQPTVSHKGGAAGFVRVIDPTITPHTRGEVSKYVPDAHGNAPLPGWKKIDALQPFLPSRFQGLAEAEHDVITLDGCGQRLLHGDG